MINVAFKLPADLVEEQAKKVREAAAKGLAQSRGALEKLNVAAKDAAGSVEASSSIVAKGLSEFNAKALEAFQANSALSLEFFAALASAPTAADAAKLPAEHAKKQFEALTAQAKDLSSLAQKIATESAEPLKDHLSKLAKVSA